jgi:mersacidin/lichenicidin family type 2 lantibiotic
VILNLSEPQQQNHRKETTMRIEDIVRAWKDEEYRATLSDEERELLLPSPIGYIELTDADLELVAGGALPTPTKIRITCDNDCQTRRPLSRLTNCCYA